MRITFIGTTHGVPEPGRKYSCTLVEAGDKKYIIDAGTDPMPEIISRGIYPNEISAIFITHRHGDHTGGLTSFVDLCSWFYKDADPLIFLPDMRLKDAIRAFVEVADNHMRENIRFEQVREGVIYDDGVMRVTAMHTGHIENAFAYKLEAEGKKVLFTGDMKPNDGPTVDYARFTETDVFDAVIAECAHFNAMEYLAPIRKNPPKRFFFNHYSWAFVESCHHLRTTLENEVPVVLVTDGYEVRL